MNVLREDKKNIFTFRLVLTGATLHNSPSAPELQWLKWRSMGSGRGQGVSGGGFRGVWWGSGGVLWESESGMDVCEGAFQTPPRPLPDNPQTPPRPLPTSPQTTPKPLLDPSRIPPVPFQPPTDSSQTPPRPFQDNSHTPQTPPDTPEPQFSHRGSGADGKFCKVAPV